jgi:MoaA/NifB/PqqE/SkfB family radical SAM enzyme
MNKQAKIIIGFNCNNNCLFCYDKLHKNLPEKTTEELKEEIYIAFKKGYSEIHFIGGEPTIRKDICELIKYAKNLGLKTVITTNGRMLAYASFANQLVKSGGSQIFISLHGHNQKVHDRITQSKGAFCQVISGIFNLKKIGFKNLAINTAIVKQNYRFLPEIAKIAVKLKVSRVDFIYVAVASKFSLRLMKPKITYSAPYIRKALEIGKKWDISGLC